MKIAKRFVSIVVLLLGCAAAALAAEVEGRLDWARVAVLSLPVSGTVVEVSVRPGERVERGQILVSLDPRHFEIDIRRTQAELDAVQPAREQAAAALALARELHQRLVATEQELQQALQAFAVAEAAVRIAEARLARARLDLEMSTLRAPFDGVVVELEAAPGESIAAALQTLPLVVLADSGQLLARTELAPAQLDDLEVGDELNVVLGEQALTGIVHHITLEPVSQSELGPVYGLEVLLPMPWSSELRMGQPVLIELPL